MSRYLTFSMVLVIVSTLCERTLAVSPLGTIEKDFHFHANGLLLDPNQPLLYASTNSGLEIINTNTLTVVNNLPIPYPSFAMTLSLDGSKLYIAGGVSDSLTVMNTQTQTFQPSVYVSGPVYSVAAGLNNRLFVSGSSQSTLQVDATTGASVGPNLPNSFDIGGLQISPDHKTLFAATYGISPGSLYKFDVSTNTPSLLWSNGNQDIGENGQQLVLSPDGKMVAYVCGYGDGGYQIPNFSTANMTLKNIFPTGAYPNALAFSPDEKFAYALHSDYPTAVNVYDTTTSALVGQFNAADRGHNMLVDNSGQHLFVSFDDVYNNNSDLIVYGTGHAVPEPSTWLLAATAIVCLATWHCRRRWTPAIIAS